MQFHRSYITIGNPSVSREPKKPMKKKEKRKKKEENVSEKGNIKERSGVKSICLLFYDIRIWIPSSIIELIDMRDRLNTDLGFLIFVCGNALK
jgi:hypothetical protein